MKQLTAPTVIYIKFAHENLYKKRDVIMTDTSKWIVINGYCHDAWWKKVLRYFGFKIWNREGLVKVKRKPY